MNYNISDNSNVNLDVNATEVVNITYCNLTRFSNSYRGYHGYLSILVCVFGSVANILNVCVLTTREMRWPTNFILTGLAVADLFVMLEYIPYASFAYLEPQSRMTIKYFSYGRSVYMMFHASFAQVCHFISCCLTVILAIWRYIAISYPQNNKLWDIVSNKQKTLIAIFLTYAICPIVCLPLFLSLRIFEQKVSLYPNDTIISKKALASYTGNKSEGLIYIIKHSGVFKDISFVIYGLVLKLVPCIFLTLLSKQLISALIKTKRRRRDLLNNTGIPLIECNGKKAYMKQRHLEKEHQTDRTTRMLLAVLLLFLITEFPQAILALFGVVLGEIFFKQCYSPLGE